MKSELETKFDQLLGNIEDYVDDVEDCIEKLQRNIRQIWVAVVALTVTLSIMFLSGCSGYTYNGIRGDDIRNITLNHVGGIAASLAMHTAGHCAAASIMGKSMHFEGTSEIVDDNMSDGQAILFASSGYISQLAFGYGLKFAGYNNDFTRAYNATTLAQIAFYDSLNSAFGSGGGNDLDMIDDYNGNSKLIHAVAIAAAIGLNVGRK